MKYICHYCKKEIIDNNRSKNHPRKYCNHKCERLQYFKENPRLYRNEKWLKEHYLRKKLSTDKISQILGVSHTSVYQWIKRFGIKTRPQPSSGRAIGKNNPSWKGGICNPKKGYIFIKTEKHPRRDNRGYVSQHTIVMEKKLGRYLVEKECIHHLDGNKKNNKIKNLKLFLNAKQHREYEELINFFAKQLIWGNLKPKLKLKLQKLFKEFSRE